jgi:hypothetical protein
MTHLLNLLISINSAKLFTFRLSRKIATVYNGQHFVVLVLDGVVCYGKEIEVLYGKKNFIIWECLQFILRKNCR